MMVVIDNKSYYTKKDLCGILEICLTTFNNFYKWDELNGRQLPIPISYGKHGRKLFTATQTLQIMQWYNNKKKGDFKSFGNRYKKN